MLYLGRLMMIMLPASAKVFSSLTTSVRLKDSAFRKPNPSIRVVEELST